MKTSKLYLKYSWLDHNQAGQSRLRRPKSTWTYACLLFASIHQGDVELENQLKEATYFFKAIMVLPCKSEAEAPVKLVSTRSNRNNAYAEASKGS